MRWLVIVVLLVASSAAGDTSVGASVRTQIYVTSTDTVVFGGRAAVAHTWAERWQLGALAGVAVGDQAEHQFLDALGEGAIWLHPSPKLDLALGWRAGYSYIHLRYGAHVHALIVEPVFALRFPIGARLALVVEPFHASLYHSGPWEATLGAEVGLRWTL